MVYIYVLKLQQDKYYVGKTDNPAYRLETHFKEGGSAFTKRFKPLEIHKLIPNQTAHDEQRITQEYMNTYGIQDVRGGPWTKIMLTDEEEEFIQQLLYGETDSCYVCGKGGHFANRCPTKSKKSKQPKKYKKSTKGCERCGRASHNQSRCNAKTHKDGSALEEQQFLCKFCEQVFHSKKGCTFHENIHCHKRRNIKNNGYDVGEAYSSSEEESDEECCGRCGRTGHTDDNCYAKKHFRGKRLSR